MIEIAPAVLDGLELTGEHVTFVSRGRSADVFRAGDLAVKLFRTNLPRAKNEFHALSFLKGQCDTPRVRRYFKNEHYAAIAIDWVHHRAKVSDLVPVSADTLSAVGTILAQLHDLSPDNIEVKYSSDPLPLDERLIHVARSLVDSTSDLASDGVEWLRTHSGRIGSERRLVHRDLVAHNILLADRGPIFIDWEDAALAPPAWDFVKLRRWLAPDTQASFDAGYRSIRPLPSDDEIEFFDLFECLTEWSVALKGLSVPSRALHGTRLREILSR